MVNALRSFLRTMGASIGLTISGTILNNILKSYLASALSSSDIQAIASSVYAPDTLNLSTQESEKVMDAYVTGMHTIFMMYAPVIGICCICALLIKDVGMAEKDAKVDINEKKDDNEAAVSTPASHKSAWTSGTES